MIKRRLGDPPPNVPDLRVKRVRLPETQVRTVRDGRVRLLGYWFRPRVTFIPYDGRLDGETLEFGIYRGEGGMKPYVTCHGCGWMEDDERFIYTGSDGQKWYIFDVWDYDDSR